MQLPYMKKPCISCPFKKHSSINNLGKARIIEILDSVSFVCHKNTKLQCAGHMILLNDSNGFVRLANRLGETLQLLGHSEIFATKDDCIQQHSLGDRVS